MGLIQCKHPADKEETFLGPQITPEDLTVLNNIFVSAFSMIDFQKESQYFTSIFSESASWTITIRGDESHAVKKITGVGSVLDISTSSWDGSSDSVFFFKSKEKCTATLSFYKSTLLLTDHFDIQREKRYEGLLIDDFEKDTILGSKIGLTSSYTDAGDTDTLINFSDNSTKVQGNYSLRFSGLDANADYWIGGVKTADNALSQKLSNGDATKLYINLSVYGETENQAGINIKFSEDDNNSGAYEAGNDDSYSYLLKVDWKGWKRIAIPYSSFSDDNTVTGDNVTEPGRLLTMNMAVVAYTSTQLTRVNLDYILLSTGSPISGSVIK
jgi:hypothetical protein